MTPKKNCHELIDLLSRAKTAEEIHSICSVFCEQFEFDRFLYGARIPTSFVKPYFIFISGYPSDWWKQYTAKGYITIDPIVRHGMAHLTPISWNQVGPQEDENEQIRRFMGEAREFGLNSGVSFPIHSAQGEFAMLNLASSKNHAQAKSSILEAMPYASLFSAYLHEAVRRVFEHQMLPLNRVHLTNREKQCLLWAAEGKTTWETSHILSVSERTVVFHLQNAAEKLKVVRRQQAVARAVSLGLIAPQLG
ncbi:MAG: autoinducer binding domain-containing protein [Sulfuricaulis sp.]